MTQLLRTKDYSMFKLLEFNREKERGHINNLKKELIKDNHLDIHPIIVNLKDEVIEGQHRLAAAEELGIEVFFLKKDVAYEHILKSNFTQKKWGLIDAIRFWALKDKKASYVKLLKYTQDLKVSGRALLGLLASNLDKEVIDFIKNGEFVFPSEMFTVERIINQYKDFLAYVKERRLRPLAMFNNAKFTMAFRDLVLLPKFDEEVFYKKLDQKWYEIRPEVSARGWMESLLNVYNWKNHSPLEETEEQL